MARKTEDLLAAALELPAEARASLAAELIRSLDGEEGPDEVEAAWSDEIRGRLEEADAGRVVAVPLDEATRRLRAASGRGEAG